MKIYRVKVHEYYETNHDMKFFLHEETAKKFKEKINQSNGWYADEVETFEVEEEEKDWKEYH